jgi:transposase InsO family protein
MSEKNETRIRLELAAQLAGRKPKTFLRWAERKRIPLLPDPEDGRRRLVSTSDLPPEITKAFFERQAHDAMKELTAVSSVASGNDLQPNLPFTLRAATETALRAAAPPGIAERYRRFIAEWTGILGDCHDGTWARYRGHTMAGILIENRDSFIRATSRINGRGFAPSTIYKNLGILNHINRNPDIPPDWKMAEFWKRMLPKPRPGRSGHQYFCQQEHVWQGQRLLHFFLTQAKRSVPHARGLLLTEIKTKLAIWGPGPRCDKPTLSQCRTFLKGIDLPTLTLAREGEKKFNDRCAPYLSRKPDGLHSNDLWVTDQKEVDVRLRDGGERVGRIWEVNFLDVASDKGLGVAFGPTLDSDMVMRAVAMAIERHGVPKAVYMDLGKEFTCKAFNGSVRRISGEALYGEARGLWNALDVSIVKTIGENAQAKSSIERYNGIQTRFDKECPGYCGSSPDTRPEKLDQEERQHAAWLKTGQGRSPLWTVSQYVRAKLNWIENEWNAKTRGRGKMRQGMTPNEAYNVKRPAQGFRTVTDAELDLHTADHRFVKVARGGQLNLTFYGQTVEYVAPELFNLQGVQVEAIISRRTFRKITVIYPINGGSESCIATVKPQMEWLPDNREELRLAMRCKAAVHRAAREGVRAMRLEAEAGNPVELLEMQKALPAREQVGGQKLFGLPSLPAPSHREISSVEYMAQKLGLKRPRFANERAAAVVAVLKEE